MPPGFGAGEGEVIVSGPLTAATAAVFPKNAKAAAVEDFTKVFLDDLELRSFLDDRTLYVRASLDCAGIVAVLRGVSRKAFLGKLDPETAARIAFNPYELEIRPMEAA